MGFNQTDFFHGIDFYMSAMNSVITYKIWCNLEIEFIQNKSE